MSGTTYDATALTTTLTSVGSAALPYLGAGVAGMVAIAGASLGINKAWSVFRKGAR